MAAKTTTRTRTTSLHPCACSVFLFGIEGEDTDYGTGCTRMTNRIFAQGHDAKLVGFLVRADMAGEEIASVDGGIRRTYLDAVHAAGSISEALATKAQAQYDAAVKRVAKKANKPKVTKTRKQAMNDLVERQTAQELAKPTTREAFIKVGRWTHNATIDLATGTATWTSKVAGTTKSAELGQYTEV